MRRTVRQAITTSGKRSRLLTPPAPHHNSPTICTRPKQWASSQAEHLSRLNRFNSRLLLLLLLLLFFFLLLLFFLFFFLSSSSFSSFFVFFFFLSFFLSFFLIIPLPLSLPFLFLHIPSSLFLLL